MAVVNTQNMQMSWARDLDKIAMDSYTRWSPTYKEICEVSTESKQHYLKKALIATLGGAVEIPQGGAVPFDTFKEGPSKTVYFSKFGLGMQLTEEAIDDDQNSLLKNIAGEIGKAMAYTTELKAWDLLNSGFLTTRLGVDSVVFFSASHPLYGTTGVTKSNIVTGAISRTAIQNAITAFKAMVNEMNIPMLVNGPYLLIAHPSQEWILREIVGSQLQPETGNNAINPLYGTNISYMTSPFITNANYWFLC
ncbi:MAG: hypothetical protein FJ109_20695, partial [Deltaproteobacteria bacterium]|nr:hypothetical protein [Deltaproteobacteria bacterium]